MLKLRPILVLFFLMGTFVLIGRAQDSACLTRAISINVIDKAGSHVPVLNPTDFKAEFRGKPIRILSVTANDEPRHIRILLDTSTSMFSENNGKWPIALRVTEDIVRAFPQSQEISLFTFADKIEERFEATSRDEILTRLKGLAPGRKAFSKGTRSTAIFDSILELSTDPSPLRRGDVLYVITDTDDNRSQDRYSVIERQLISKGFRLFAFILLDTGEMNKTYEEAEGAQRLVDLVRATGGIPAILMSDPRLRHPNYEYVLGGAGALNRLLQNQFKQVAQYDTLQILLPEMVDKPRSWKLTLANVGGGSRKDLSVYYPQKLAPCGNDLEQSATHNP